MDQVYTHYQASSSSSSSAASSPQRRHPLYPSTPSTQRKPTHNSHYNNNMNNKNHHRPTTLSLNLPRFSFDNDAGRDPYSWLLATPSSNPTSLQPSSPKTFHHQPTRQSSHSSPPPHSPPHSPPPHSPPQSTPPSPMADKPFIKHRTAASPPPPSMDIFNLKSSTTTPVTHVINPKTCSCPSSPFTSLILPIPTCPTISISAPTSPVPPSPRKVPHAQTFPTQQQIPSKAYHYTEKVSPLVITSTASDNDDDNMPIAKPLRKRWPSFRASIDEDPKPPRTPSDDWKKRWSTTTTPVLPISISLNTSTRNVKMDATTVDVDTGRIVEERKVVTFKERVMRASWQGLEERTSFERSVMCVNLDEGEEGPALGASVKRVDSGMGPSIKRKTSVASEVMVVTGRLRRGKERWSEGVVRYWDPVRGVKIEKSVKRRGLKGAKSCEGLEGRGAFSGKDDDGEEGRRYRSLTMRRSVKVEERSPDHEVDQDVVACERNARRSMSMYGWSLGREKEEVRRSRTAWTLGRWAGRKEEVEVGDDGTGKVGGVKRVVRKVKSHLWVLGKWSKG
ncbi:hypothetical protein BC829DRAFT_124359 [Chytridium lagenaria]|nr:hypothetical protein BC829DRAFT_124359 [Chytridium lagenaria]